MHQIFLSIFFMYLINPSSVCEQFYNIFFYFQRLNWIWLSCGVCVVIIAHPMHESIQKCVVIVGFSLIPLVCWCCHPACWCCCIASSTRRRRIAGRREREKFNDDEQWTTGRRSDSTRYALFNGIWRWCDGLQIGVRRKKIIFCITWHFAQLHGQHTTTTTNCQYNKKKLTDAVIVENVEHERRRSHELEEWCECHTSWLDEFVLPAPPGTANTGGKRLWALVATSQPTAQFAQFHLSQWHIGCNANKEKYKKLVVIHGWLGIDGWGHSIRPKKLRFDSIACYVMSHCVCCSDQIDRRC